MARRKSRRSQPTLWESAARGATAGLVGGAALAAAHRLVLPRFPDRINPRVHRWDARVQRAAKRMGLELSPRGRTVLGWTTQLAVATLIGAAYAVVEEQMQPSRATKQLLDSGLVFAASMLAPEMKPRRKPRGRKARLRRAALQRVTAPSIYGKATTLALKALAR